MSNSSSIFWSALGGAIGGGIVTSLPWILRTFLKGKIKRYQSVTEQNHGQNDETRGEIYHGYGNRIPCNVAQKNGINTKIDLWEWRTGMNKRKASSILYGPYASDFAGKAGNHQVKFKIMGRNFKKDDDRKIIELEAAKLEAIYIKEGSNIIEKQPQNVLCRRFISAKDLARKGFQIYTCKFYSDGNGVWEYRINIYDGVDRQCNIEEKNDPRIYFSHIDVR